MPNKEKLDIFKLTIKTEPNPKTIHRIKININNKERIANTITDIFKHRIHEPIIIETMLIIFKIISKIQLRIQDARKSTNIVELQGCQTEEIIARIDI